MRRLLLSFLLLVCMASSAMAAGAHSIKEIRAIGSNVAVLFTKANGTGGWLWYIANDDNKKYYVSSALTALSTGNTVTLSATKIGGVTTINSMRIFGE